MTKKSDKGSGVSLEPEFLEIASRLKRKGPELDAILDHSASEGPPSEEGQVLWAEIDAEWELLKNIRGLLDAIQPAERPVGRTAKGRPSPLKTILIGVRLPVALDEELKALGGLKSRHIERAIMLYLKVLKGTDND